MKLLTNFLRSLLYPGLDLHVRDRARLAKYWRTGPREVLDAGSGNGYFAWLAYQSGARVTAFNFDQGQVEKARLFLNGYRKADPARLRFEQRNLYDLDSETRRFDEIICYEVLEHLRQDSAVLQQFYRLLKPGGVLHLCCPNKMHPRHQAEVLDTEEAGGHVRPGYTEQEYRDLLEPLGFRVEMVVGIGTRAIYLADALLRAIRNRLGDLFAFPFFPLALPTVWLASANPQVPFSLYARAVKPDRLQ